MKPGARVLILPAGIEQVHVIRKAKAMGLFVVAVDPNPGAVGFPLADVAEVASPRDIDRCLTIARTHGIDAVVADQCDYSLFASACIAEVLNLRAPSVRAAQFATNKRLMREEVARAGLDQPPFRACRTFEEAERALEAIGLPAIAKPVDNRGCFGVSTIRSANELRDSFFEALIHAHSREVLLETFLEGTMVTVDGYCFRPDCYLALGVASKRKVGGRRNVDMEVMYPAELAPDTIDQVLDYNRRVVEALGLTFGATHGGYLVDSDGTPYLIEIANRGGGVYTAPVIVPSLSFAPVPELLLRNAFGEFPQPDGVEVAPQKRSTVLGFFDFGVRGTLSAVRGVEEALAIPGVLAIHLLAQIGQPLPDITHGPSRHGFVIATGPTPDETRRLVTRVRDTIRIETQ